MKTVNIQIINPISVQSARIQEPVDPGFEVTNALAYFGFKESDVKWFHNSERIAINGNSSTIMCGEIVGTDKIVTIVI